MSDIKVGRKNDAGKVDYALVDMTVFAVEGHELFSAGCMRDFNTQYGYEEDSATEQGRWVHAFSRRMRSLARGLEDEFPEAYAENQVRAFNLFVAVMNAGAKKYAAHNWQLVRPISRYESALIRHDFAAHVEGILALNTDDFGLPHLAHSMWNCYALAWFARAGVK